MILFCNKFALEQVILMSDWFTVEKIDSTTFAISEYSHWEETHCYLLCGDCCAILIDSGLGVANIKNVVNQLTSLPVMVITTHVHWDHIGGHSHFEQFAVHELEIEWLTGNFPLSLQMVKRNLTCRSCKFPAEFDIDQYQIFQGAPQRVLYDGVILNLGNRNLRVIHTPGHSPGHCCFYELERKYLYTGDLVYKGCLDAFYPTTDPQLFLQSLQKIKSLEINRIFPGHHQLALSTKLLFQIEAGFRELADKGVLKQGNGVFDFGLFSIHI